MEITINGVINPETILVKDLVNLGSNKEFEISMPVLSMLNLDHNVTLTRDDDKENIEEEYRDKEVHYRGEVLAGNLHAVFYKQEDEEDGPVFVDLHIMSMDGCFGFGG